VRGAITVVEQYYTENANAYPTSLAGPVSTLSFGGLTVAISPGNQLHYESFTTGTNSGYKICGMNTEAGTIYSYNSIAGGGVRKAAETTLALCVAAHGT
jgi:type IV pilus assembly protein PilA